MFKTTGMNPGIYLGDIVRFYSMSAHDLYHCVQRRMRAATARILFNGNAWLYDIEWICPMIEDLFAIECPGTVEHVEESLFVLKRLCVGGETLLRQQRCEEAVSGTVTHVK